MTPHDLLAAFEILAEAPDGIARLRELVLQLAVRGKLVLQDPNDEPACVLLERIAAEKARLVKEGKNPKSKPLPPVGEDEVPFEVPEGWVWCRAEHLFEFVTSGSRGWAQFYSKDGPVFLRIGNLDYGTTRLDLNNIQHVQPPANSEGTRTRTMPGDILVSITGDTGMVGLIPDGMDESYINQHIAMCRPVAGTWPPYIALAFTSPPLLDQLQGYQRGIKNSLGLDDIRILRFPLPSLPEQHRIVAKVGALMALLERLEAARHERETTRAALRDATLAALRDTPDAEAVEAAWTRIAERMDDLFTDPADVSPLRQTILQLAVRGKLVPQDPNDEPACMLLECIAAQKARLVKGGKIAKPKPLPSVAEEEVPFELPEGWVLSRLGELIELVSGQHLGPLEYHSEPAGLPYFTGPADFGPVHPRATRWTAERRAVASAGDILLTVKGAGIGKANVLDAPEAAISRQLMAIRPPLGMGSYLNLVVANAASHFREKQQGIAIPGIGREDVLYYSLAVPPLPEQHRIVAKVDALMALCDALEARLAAAHKAQAAFAAAVVYHLDT